MSKTQGQLYQSTVDFTFASATYRLPRINNNTPTVYRYNFMGSSIECLQLNGLGTISVPTKIETSYRSTTRMIFQNSGTPMLGARDIEQTASPPQTQTFWRHGDEVRRRLSDGSWSSYKKYALSTASASPRGYAPSDIWKTAYPGSHLVKQPN